MAAVAANSISFSYDFDEDISVLNDITVKINKGEFVTILGKNGCGKSTLVKHFNALLSLQKGSLKVAGFDVKDEKNIYELRRNCGMVFQNPDSQFVSSVIQEDIAFGLENYDTPQKEIPKKVSTALDLVGLSGFEKRSPHTLSGGQKQRVALAGVLAMEPQIIIFDEATSMLDPKGRKEVLENMKRLHSLGKTVIMITHYVEEAIFSDKVILMDGGKILASGTPYDILTDLKLLKKAGLIPPFAVKLYNDLRKNGIMLKNCPLTNVELVEELCRLK